MQATRNGLPTDGEVRSSTRITPTTPYSTVRVVIRKWDSSAPACWAMGAPEPMAWKPTSS
ncbi:hypothetical protein ACIBMZ_05780 [Micromonospora sp. NPDC049900]|uniref:hypothetical protein n=1 Tax=Micromonospora sp. NPDC049900 TaxID=3364275 RepID=UPI003798CDA0